jgi:transposase
MELWLGDAGKIRAAEVRKQKTDRRDAAHLLQLLLAGRFPRIWVPSLEERDLRQLLVHRHKQVQARLSRKLCVEESCGSLETGLEHGIELGQGGADGTAGTTPALLFET